MLAYILPTVLAKEGKSNNKMTDCRNIRTYFLYVHHGLNITILGDVNDFLGVHVSKEQDGRIHVSQPHLIDQIIKTTFQTNAKPKPTPAKSSAILWRHRSLASHTPEFNYRTVIGKLNYLERGSRSDISYATHQCARFCSDPKHPHVEAVRWLVRYLIGT